MALSESEHPRRTYLRHRGRMTRAQSRALNELGPDILISGDVPDWPEAFGRDAPIGVEIGFGMGHALLDWAEQRPDWNLVGIEVYQPGIGALLLGMQRSALTNLRVIADDAQSVLTRCFGSESIDEVRVFFPDPWPKKRHHKRRLVQAQFVSLLAERMHVDAKLLLATDWQHYAESMLEVLDANPLLTNLAGPGSFAERAEIRPATRFEDRGRKLGHQVWDLAYVRKRATTESRYR